MELSDFSVMAGVGFFDNRAKISRRCIHIAEAIRYELALLAPIEAPFAKIVIYLQNAHVITSENEVFIHEEVIEVRIKESEAVLFSDYQTFRSALINLIRGGLTQLSEFTGWRSKEMDNIILAIQERSQIFHYQLSALSKIDKITGSQINIFLDITETDSKITAMISDLDDKDVREVVVRSSDKPSGLEFFFPVVSTVLNNTSMIFLDSMNEPLAELKL